MNSRRIVGCCATVFALCLLTLNPCVAASIPAWLDDAITDYNEENPQSPFEFVDIKDSFVWYWVKDTPDIGGKDIRTGVYGHVQRHGYQQMDQEELITVGRPPNPTGTSNPERKCWRRSFVLNIDEQSNTTMAGTGQRSGQRQRMLTSLVCDGISHWYAGFRVLQ
jgi:hypothetical protein